MGDGEFVLAAHFWTDKWSWIKIADLLPKRVSLVEELAVRGVSWVRVVMFHLLKCCVPRGERAQA